MRFSKKTLIVTLFFIILLSCTCNVVSYKTKIKNFDENTAESSIDIIIPDDYSTIKSGIENADFGDNIFVRSGIYEENNILIDKKITLKGEDRNSTIIRGDFSNPILLIYSDEVIVSNFTINNGGNITKGAISIFADNCTISKNIINDNKNSCISLYDSSYNNILENKILNCTVGIYLFKSNYQNIEENKISDCLKGIYIEESNINIVKNNQIFSNEQGVFASYAKDNSIVKNNFISNIEHAKFSTWLSPNGLQINKWDQNYWDDSFGIFPKWIPGILFIPTKDEIGIFLPWGNIDWHPAQRPFKI